MRRGLHTFVPPEAAPAALWCCLGAALVIHGCSGPERARPRDVAAAPRTPVAVAPAPAAPAPVAVPAPVDPWEDRPAPPTSEPDLRVRIAALRAANASPRFTHPSGSLLVAPPGAAPRAFRTPVDVRFTGTGWAVTEAAGTPKSRCQELAGIQPVEVRPLPKARGVVGYDETDWPGSVRIVPVAEGGGPGSVDLVVDVPLERYLPGVLAKELFKNWHPPRRSARRRSPRAASPCASTRTGRGSATTT